ncbi:hypothetical protein FA15DRAFT_414450 [Coprinopsis marcescibilis]|uniref:RanBD1 domain-containing protein n=1 Tax=Coprinopsis marcescibilis TaxID=230819 RepID=A0A5C3L8J1_COPMA|nr:hypothetical protein FA15DRAFT_414450 [Coprinopsis marcescibilis]
MFPISDFNFVFCSIATVAATVGYAFTRKQNPGVTPALFAAQHGSENANGSRQTPSSSSSPSSPMVNVVEKVQQEAQASRSKQTSTTTFSATATANNTTATTTTPSRKRKVPHDGFDEPVHWLGIQNDCGYPHNLRNIYPNKRNKSQTPAVEAEEKEKEKEKTLNTIVQRADAFSVDCTMESAEPDTTLSAINQRAPECALTATATTDLVEGDESEALAETVETVGSPPVDPPRTPSPAPVPVAEAAPSSSLPAAPLTSARGFASSPSPFSTPAPAQPTVRAAFSPFAAAPKTPSPAPRASTSTVFGSTNSWMASTSTPPAFTSGARFGSNSSAGFGGFAAFAGSSSPFASVKKSGMGSSFREPNAVVQDVGGKSEESDDNEGTSGGAEETQDVHAISPALKAVASKVKAKGSSQHVTGEENEDVEQEIKGVKLFIKRGNKPFASGMVGHLKLLSDRKTLAERLLFRREPLWQVSMNVRVTAATRCVYDVEEGVMRITLKEPVVGGKEGSEVVIYALKPGRACSKQDFREFVEALVNNISKA